MSVPWLLRRKHRLLLAVLLCLVPLLPALAQEVPAPGSTASVAVSGVAPSQETAPAPTPAPAPAAPSAPAAVPDAPVPAPVAEVVPAAPAPEAAAAASAASPAAAVTAAPAPDGTPAPAVAGTEAKAPAADALFDYERWPIAIIIVIVLGLVTWFTMSAQRGKEMFIRRISGLSALEDAVGRATEMGRGVLYIPGIWDMDDIQTIAGVTILGHVAKKTAEYDTPLYAPMTRSFVMSVAQEVVKQSYLEKGRPDAFRPDRINYLTDDQFGYVAGVGGIMMREKPAACFYLGCFFAESLILAETGSSVGAIQIAGTAEPSQIPFFVAACDYTLIGEELFAASAYLSRNPKEVGSLKGQDMCKLIIIAAIIIGTLLISVSQTEWGKSSEGLKRVTEKYMSFLSIE